MTSFVYPMLSFFEQAYSSETEVDLFNSNFYCEISFLAFFLFDLCLETLHRIFDKDRKLKDSFLYNHKYMQKILIFTIILTDIIYYTVSFPSKNIRFGRFLRPCKIFKFIFLKNKFKNKKFLFYFTLKS